MGHLELILKGEYKVPPGSKTKVERPKSAAHFVKIGNIADDVLGGLFMDIVKGTLDLKQLGAKCEYHKQMITLQNAIMEVINAKSARTYTWSSAVVQWPLLMNPQFLSTWVGSIAKRDANGNKMIPQALREAVENATRKKVTHHI